LGVLGVYYLKDAFISRDNFYYTIRFCKTEYDPTQIFKMISEFIQYILGHLKLVITIESLGSHSRCAVLVGESGEASK
jgi:hypothetical protein